MKSQYGGLSKANSKTKRSAPYALFQDYRIPRDTKSQFEENFAVQNQAKKSNHEMVLEMIQKRKLDRVISITDCSNSRSNTATNKSQTRNTAAENEKSTPDNSSYPRILYNPANSYTSDTKQTQSMANMGKHQINRTQGLIQTRSTLDNQSISQHDSFQLSRPPYSSFLNKSFDSSAGATLSKRTVSPAYESPKWEQLVADMSKKIGQTKLLQFRSKIAAQNGSNGALNARVNSMDALIARNELWLKTRTTKKALSTTKSPSKSSPAHGISPKTASSGRFVVNNVANIKSATATSSNRFIKVSL